MLDPKTGGVLAMASYPTFNPADFVDGISDAEWDAAHRRGEQHPAQQLGDPGPVRARVHLQALHARSPALEAGLITPDTTVYDDGEYEVPDCTGDSCAFSNDRGQAVRRRRPAPVAHRVVRLLLLRPRRPVLDPAGPRSAAPRGTPTCSSSGASTPTPGIDLSSEQAGRIPSPTWLDRVLRRRRAASDGSDSWRTGNNVNMAIGQGDVLLTPLQLASGYATIGNGGTVWQPHVVKEVRDGVTKELKRTIEPEGSSAPVELTPEWRQALYDGLTGVTTQDGGTAVGAFSGFPHDTFPVAAKTGTAQVGSGNKAPTAVFGAYGPATDAAVRHLGAARGVGLRRLGGGARWPGGCSTCCATRPCCPPAPEGGRFEVLDALAPDAPGTCATDGHHHLLHPRPGRARRRSAACPATRPRRGATSTSCSSAASSPSARSAA